ncbi:hypothetical protein GGD81_000798 [Rhodobium orientis]|uniref:DUF3592 domain-containing protein n=1 Tax=Rhodobium orientis TaxID=34017 RepID=A0A327JTI8_9HYPH|nr:DUF3592 domain-containing protein [Rhodobium orientis]MBB4301781.1 hypothetical protein [Rhodobium orientis]MBK5950580.1 hypothetical protein [Rhodobium orientis]RAI28222.1 hypothetical protein CH339_07710 [Rhodobium orientis]
MILNVLRPLIDAREIEGAESPKKSPLVRMLSFLMPVLILADLILFWRGMVSGGVGLAVVLFVLRFVLNAALRDVAEAERDAASDPEARTPPAPQHEHPFDRLMHRFGLVGKFGLSSVLGVVSAVFFIAGVMITVAIVTKGVEATGLASDWRWAEAEVLAKTRQCLVRGRNGAPDRLLDEAVCELRRDKVASRQVVPVLTIRYPLDDGSFQGLEVRQYKVAHGRVAIGDKLPIAYDPDNPERFVKRQTNYWHVASGSVMVPLLLFAVAYGAGRWRRRLVGAPSPARGVVKRARDVRQSPPKDEPRTRLAGDAGAMKGRAGQDPVAAFRDRVRNAPPRSSGPVERRRSWF